MAGMSGRSSLQPARAKLVAVAAVPAVVVTEALVGAPGPRPER